MTFYVYAGRTVSSSSALTELPAARGARADAADIAFELCESAPDPGFREWIHECSGPDDLPALALARQGQDYLLRFPGLADFVISADGRRVSASGAAGTNAATVNHLLLDQVLPRVLAHMGRLVVHASAVRLGNRCVAFLGESGAGKSTLASSFLVAGSSLLADDGLVLSLGGEGVLAIPTYRSLRVWPDTVSGVFRETPSVVPMAHYSAKRRVVMPEGQEEADAPIPLSALYILAPGTDTGAHTISMTKLSARDACMAVVANAFQLDVTDSRRTAEAFAAAGDIAERIPAFELTYPRNFASLAAVRSAIANHHATSPAG